MIPLRDVQRTRGVPLIVIALIGVNIAVYLHQLFLGAGQEAFVYHYALVPAKFWDISTYARNGIIGGLLPLATSLFLHGSPAHVGVNMLYLWIFGDNVEERLGTVRFLVFYSIAGMAAGLAQVLVSPGSEVPTVGASGAISGVLAAYWLLFPAARIVTWIPILLIVVVEVPAFVFVGFWFIIQILSGMRSLGSPEMAGGVAWFAHLGGFAAGILLVRVFDKGRSQRGRSDSSEDRA